MQQIKINRDGPLYRVQIEGFEALNLSLYKAFLRELDGEQCHQSHFELSRFENTYINQEATPEITPLINTAKKAAEQILNQHKLKIGYWFNIMQPGNKTLRHNHDEDDELLSCVYYIETPNHCGDLLVHHKEGIARVSPQAGEMIFFSPKLAHEVEENRSEQPRLSVAFNFGHQQ